MDEWLTSLTSEDPSIRYRGIVELRHVYDIDVGEALVRALINEKVHEVWWIAAITVLPVWLPFFDRELSSRESWPFTGSRTLRVLELAGPYPLHSAERHIEEWLRHEKWEFRFSGFRWLQIGGNMDSSFAAAVRLLETVDVAFQVDSEAASKEFWMEEFGQIESRKLELEKFIESIT